MNLSKTQFDIINAKENRIGVEASAASGKTTVLTERVRKMLKDGINPNDIAVITYTRMAAGNLIDRLGSDYKDGIFVGTIHSLAARQLAINGFGSQIKKVAEDENFDKLFDLCYLNIELTHIYKYVLVDECQDCGIKELKFIFELIDPENFFCVYDRKQTIYEFRGAKPSLLYEYLYKKNTTFYDLNENYRNKYSILEYAKKIISRCGMNDKSISMNIGGRVIEESLNKNSYTYLLRYIETNGNFNDWAILCRTNKELYKIEQVLKKYNIPYNTFKQGDITKAQLEKMMGENKIQLLTIHSAKGLEWNNVAVFGTRWWNKEECRVNYVAATRAKDFLLWFK